MSKIGAPLFPPERILWIGGAILGLGLLTSIPFIASLYTAPPLFVAVQKERRGDAPGPLTFSLALSERGPALPIPELEGEMTFSFDPPRPLGEKEEKRLLVRMKQGGDSKRIVLPCRLDLEFQGDRLGFAKKESPFWIELSLMADGRIEGKGWITSFEGKTIPAGTFCAAGHTPPIQGAHEFAEGSPFRALAEAKWWGKDRFREEGGERLEIAETELLEVSPGDWLSWKKGKWEKSGVAEKEGPIAQFHLSSEKGALLEGWDAEGHVRISLSPAVAPPFKMRAEELLSSVRIRSEKQISCMLEKQSLILKVGDWVCKTGDKWRLLRKKEDRDAFVRGEIAGDLFVFDKIEKGQKVIGTLFHSSRLQAALIELPAVKGKEDGAHRKRRQK